MVTMRFFKNLTSIEFIRFCIVGSAGFLINYALLSLFYTQLKLPVFLSQMLASEVALFHNFALHHNWTYRDRLNHRTILDYITRFHATSWSAIIGSAIIVSFMVNTVQYNYGLALVVSSVIALFWNFLWTKYFVWGVTRSVKEIQTNSSD